MWDAGAGSLAFWYSLDGITWLLDTTRTSQTQPDRIGLAFYSNGAPWSRPTCTTFARGRLIGGSEMTTTEYRRRLRRRFQMEFLRGLFGVEPSQTLVRALDLAEADR